MTDGVNQAAMRAGEHRCDWTACGATDPSAGIHGSDRCARCSPSAGRTVIADERPLTHPEAAGALVAGAGRVDVLLANLAIPAPNTPADQVTDEEWRAAFAHLVDPLPRLARAVLPQMIERRAGKILVMGSASALRG